MSSFQPIANAMNLDEAKQALALAEVNRHSLTGDSLAAIGEAIVCLRDRIKRLTTTQRRIDSIRKAR